jgi:hypothetical protein
MEQSETAGERAPAAEDRRSFFDRLFRRRPSPNREEIVLPMDGPVHFLVDERVQETPDREGIVALWERSTLIYLGAAPQNLGGIRGELQAKRRAGGCTQSATHFQFEINDNSASRLRHLLEEYQRRNDSQPRCNQ